jgi:glycosyltransferase involved in cell wall biosynthesis
MADPRLKVRFLIMNAFAVGGTIRATFTLAGELAKRHDVEIVSVYRLRTADPALRVPDGVRLRTLTDLRAPTLERQHALRRWLYGQRSRLFSSNDIRYRNFSLLTDVALLRFLASVRDGILIGTRPGLNLAIAHLASESVVRVGQDHLNLKTYHPGLRANMRAAYGRLDLLSTLTERDAAAYRRMLGDRPPVECFPNPAPDVGGRRASHDDKVVVAAGRLTRQKAFDRLIDAWADVAPRHPDWQLRIFGEGPKRPTLERRIERHGIADSAHLMGFTDRLHDELARASLFAMTSRVEGFPMVLLEAMGVGLPVVSVDCYTGPSDIVTDGVDGRIVPEEDRPALVKAMGELMADEERRRAFGAAALEAADRYDLGRIAARWEERLTELSAAKRGRRTIAGPLLAVAGRKAMRRLSR